MAYGDSNDDSGTDPRASSRPTEADGAMSGTDPRASARPTRADERASARPPEDADVGTVGDEPGLLERVGSAASSLGSRVSDAAGDALEPSQSGGDSGGSLFEMGGDGGGGGTGGLELGPRLPPEKVAEGTYDTAADLAEDNPEQAREFIDVVGEQVEDAGGSDARAAFEERVDELEDQRRQGTNTGSTVSDVLAGFGGDSTGSLLGMGSGNDSTAFDRLGDDRDRSSSLFEMGDGGGGNDTTAFDRLGDDRDRSSSLFEMGDGGGGNDTTAFDRLGDDDDTTAQERLNRLSEAEDSEDLYG